MIQIIFQYSMSICQCNYIYHLPLISTVLLRIGLGNAVYYIAVTFIRSVERCTLWMSSMTLNRRKIDINAIIVSSRSKPMIKLIKKY